MARMQKWKNITDEVREVAQRRPPEGTPTAKGGDIDIPAAMFVGPGETVELPGWVVFTCDFERVKGGGPKKAAKAAEQPEEG